MTAQVHENLIMDGVETSMAFCPPLPEDDPRIVECQNCENVDTESFFIYSTACWREYVGTWEIKDRKFYLVKLVGKFKLVSNEPVFADWFTGTLRIPQGEMLHYVHMGFGSIYEQEIHVKIEKGIVINSKTVDNRNKQANDGTIHLLHLTNLPGFENQFDGDEDL
jgi:hypothetical protein